MNTTLSNRRLLLFGSAAVGFSFLLHLIADLSWSSFFFAVSSLCALLGYAALCVYILSVNSKGKKLCLVASAALMALAAFFALLRLLSLDVLIDRVFFALSIALLLLSPDPFGKGDLRKIRIVGWGGLAAVLLLSILPGYGIWVLLLYGVMITETVFLFLTANSMEGVWAEAAPLMNVQDIAGQVKGGSLEAVRGEFTEAMDAVRDDVAGDPPDGGSDVRRASYDSLVTVGTETAESAEDAAQKHATMVAETDWDAMGDIPAVPITFSEGGRSYKSVAGPIALTIEKKESYDSAVRKYAQIIEEQTVGGWKLDRIQEIPVMRKAGCVRMLLYRQSFTQVNFNMLIFVREDK